MKDIFFKSPQHKERFVATMQRLGKINNGTFDPEYAAAVYILTADLSTAEKSSEYMSCRGVHIDTLLEDIDFSGGYCVLIELAGNLFNGHRHVDRLNFSGSMGALFGSHYITPVETQWLPCRERRHRR